MKGRNGMDRYRYVDVCVNVRRRKRECGNMCHICLVSMHMLGCATQCKMWCVRAMEERADRGRAQAGFAWRRIVIILSCDWMVVCTRGILRTSATSHWSVCAVRLARRH